jgi:hypothetical protein
VYNAKAKYIHEPCSLPVNVDGKEAIAVSRCAVVQSEAGHHDRRRYAGGAPQDIYLGKFAAFFTQSSRSWAAAKPNARKTNRWR